MFKKIRATVLVGIVASIFAVSAGAQTEDFSVWHKKGPSNLVLITIGVLALVIIIGVVYLRQRRKE